MALKKEKEIKGIKADYWKIVDCDVKKGFVGIGLYANRESAQVRENMLDGRTTFQIDFPIAEINPLSFAYEKIKESKLDEEGNETNWFADAENC